MQELSTKSNTQVEILNFQTFTTEYVAKNYGVNSSAIEKHKFRHQDEILENIHFIYESADTKGGKQEIVKWTLRGIIKLGMFIRSPQAKNFRIWAEQELEKSIKELEQQASSQKQVVYIEVEKANILALKQREELRAFIHDALLADSGFFVPSVYVYSLYTWYCKNYGLIPIALQGFGSSLKKAFESNGVRIAKAQKRIAPGQLKGLEGLKPYCFFGLKINTANLNIDGLEINGEKVSLSDMNSLTSPTVFIYGKSVVSITQNTPKPLLTANRQEDIIRQNERLLIENRRLKHSLFKAQNKDLK